VRGRRVIITNNSSLSSHPSFTHLSLYQPFSMDENLEALCWSIGLLINVLPPNSVLKAHSGFYYNGESMGRACLALCVLKALCLK
jgi:hypothetical protein